MKQKLLIVLLAMFVTAGTGCTMVNSMKSRVNTMTSPVDDDLYAQVGDTNQKDIQKSRTEFDIRVEEQELAKYERELAGKQKKLADQQYDLSWTRTEKAKAQLELEKMRAIKQSGLGDEIENDEAITELRSDILEYEADIVKIEGKIATSKRQIRDLEEQVEQQKEHVAELKGEDMEEPAPMEEAEKDMSKDSEDMEPTEDQEGEPEYEEVQPGTDQPATDTNTDMEGEPLQE